MDRLKKLKGGKIKVGARCRDSELADKFSDFKGRKQNRTLDSDSGRARKKLKVCKRVESQTNGVILRENMRNRTRRFRVIDDKLVKVPRKLSNLMRECKMDDDNETTESLIEKAICKHMENLCFSLKKLCPRARSFEHYFKKRDISELKSQYSVRSTGSRRNLSRFETPRTKSLSKMRSGK